MEARKVQLPDRVDVAENPRGFPPEGEDQGRISREGNRRRGVIKRSGKDGREASQRNGTRKTSGRCSRKRDSGKDRRQKVDLYKRACLPVPASCSLLFFIFAAITFLFFSSASQPQFCEFHLSMPHAVPHHQQTTHSHPTLTRGVSNVNVLPLSFHGLFQKFRQRTVS